MQYPLTISFRTVAFSNQGGVTDATGREVVYIKQKAFRLKEAITVFTDSSQSTTIGTIQADRIIDFSPRYSFTDVHGGSLGAIKRLGARSIWKASYTVFDSQDLPMLHVKEESGWTKVMDHFVSQIPLVGMFSGYMFHPSYLVTRPDGTPVGRITKQAAFFEGRFAIAKLGELAPQEETGFLLGCFTAILLERYRG